MRTAFTWLLIVRERLPLTPTGRLPRIAHFVLMTLAVYSDIAHDDYDQLARLGGITPAAARRAVKQLDDVGIIDELHRRRQEGAG